MKSVRICSFSGQYFTIRTEYEPDKLQIRTLLYAVISIDVEAK